MRIDVHSRSRNEALIGFSNEHFYQSRLQPIPGHPKHKMLSAPIVLHRVDGLYHEQTNLEEAEAVAKFVAEQLDQSDPPSIGIASFHLKQRTVIIVCLDNRALEYTEFTERLAQGRKRRGLDSFEGLFVKKLENVQRDLHRLWSPRLLRDSGLEIQ